MTETVRKITEACEKLKLKLGLDENGPYLTIDQSIKMTPEVVSKIRKLRMVMLRNRVQLIKHLGGNPEDYSWLPVDGTKEKEWYDRIKECAEEDEDKAGVYVGQDGTKWRSKEDALILLNKCSDTEEWRKMAHKFWWDTTHAKSFYSNSYDFPVD